MGEVVEGTAVPWSVFPQALRYLVLKLEPCGNQEVPVHYTRRGTEDELRKTNCEKPNLLNECNEPRSADWVI